MTQIDRLLAQANPVPQPPPGRVTPDQERLLSSIVAVPRRRRPSGAVRLLVTASAVAAIAVAVLLVVGRGAGVNDEIEATTPPAVAPTGEGDVMHVVTRLYGTVYGPGLGERLDGWLEPSTGRARIVITTGGEMTLQQVVGANDRVRSWQGALGNAGGITEDVIAPGFAANLRALVRDRMTALVESTKDGFRRDNTTLGAATTESGEYRGRAVTIHRVAPTTAEGRPSGYYFKWYSDPDTGAIIAFERGPVGDDGRDVVEMGEGLEKLETFASGQAPLHELDWKQPPALPTPTPPTPGATPTPTPETP
jgi:hypothetical protein